MRDRLPAFEPQNATQAQVEVLKQILAGPRGNLDGPFLTWIHSPELAGYGQQLGAFCRYSTGLPLRQSELAILLTAQRWRAQAEWQIHYPIAIRAGVPEDVAEALREGRAPSFTDDDDALVYQFTSELYDQLRVSDETYFKAIERWGNQVIINFTALLGYYTLVAMTLNVFEVRTQSSLDLPFQEPPA